MSKNPLIIAVCFGLFMVQMDLTIVNIALQNIAEKLTEVKPSRIFPLLGYPNLPTLSG